MSNIYVITYNNYYNRIVKNEQSLNAYINNRLEYQITNCNFNPNDGVNTEHVLGTSDYDGKGDYAIVCDNQNNIESRWFIIEAKRTRQGQWRMQLHRDVIIDYYEQVFSSKCFVEKGYVNDTDSAIFNPENMTFNQIKSKETLLYDQSKVPWIVGYYSRDEETSESLSGDVIFNSDLDAIDTGESDIEDWDLYKYTSTPCVAGGIVKNIQCNLKHNIYGNYYNNYFLNLDISNGAVSTKSKTIPNNEPWITLVSTGNALDALTAFESKVSNNAVSYGLGNLSIIAYNSLPIEEDDAARLAALDGKIVRAGAKVYAVQLSFIRDSSAKIYAPMGSNVEQDLTANIFQITSSNVHNSGNNSPYIIEYTQNAYILTLIELEQEALSYDMTGEKIVTTDAPYNIFCIPYGNVTVIDQQNDYYQTSASIGLATVMSMVQQHPKRIYDVQLLPYCPVPNLISSEGVIALTSALQYSRIVDGVDNTQGFILNVPLSSFTTSISSSIDVLETKIESECDMYRLSSPNWASAFEFNAAKNGGVSGFNVSCTYKPFTPYIRVAPSFGRLYGKDYGDARGLVLGGDFSLPMLYDNWESYQIQNKNYQLTFDRQIENMEIKHTVQRIQDVTTAFAGTVQGVITGATAGGVGGAIAGGVASAIGGIADVAISESLRNEAIDYTKDQFGYALGNIQALPHTLSKVSAYNANNKLVPVLEYYTCTEEEKQALRDKIKYNGMTIMRIGTLSDYVSSEQTYIKAKVIRIDDLGEDFHVINAIADELNKGVFV